MVKSDGTCSHKMSTTARDSVITAFAKHGIALHIDDGDTTKGWSGNGGTSVTHSPTDFVNTVDQTGNNNDFHEYYNVQFANERRGIFHYCLMAHKLMVGSGEYGGVANTPERGHFIVGEANYGDLKTGSYFMHELGHGILQELDATPTNHQSTASGDTTPTWHCRNDCAMFWSGSLKTDYCSACWFELARDGVGFGLT